MWNGTMFVDLDWPLNAWSLLSASAELLVILIVFLSLQGKFGVQQEAGLQQAEPRCPHVPSATISNPWHASLAHLYPKRVTFKLCLTTYGTMPARPGTTLSHQILYTTYRRRRPHTTVCALLINTNCSSLVRLPPRWVLGRRSAHRAHLRGTHSFGSFATQPSPSTSSDNPSKPICLIVINCV